MGDFYGGNTGSFQIAAQLGRQAFDTNEARIQNYADKTIQYNLLGKADKAQASQDETRDVEKDITSVPKVYKTGQTLSEAGRAFGTGFTRGVQQAAAGVGKGTAVTAEEAILGSGKVFTSAGLSGVGQAAARGARGARAVLSEAGAGTKIFGAGAEGVSGLTGIEGVVGGALAKASAGAGGVLTEGAETFAKVGGKAVGLLGAGIAAGEDIDNFFNTGNIFNKVGSDGKIQKQTLGEDVGNVATLFAGGLDILAAFTGGALAPLAVAANIAAATESTVASISADSAQKKQDTKDAPPSTPPPQQAPPAFAQFGLLASQSHNPLNHIG